jgi:hypothetical protein
VVRISGSGPECNGTTTLDEIEIRKKVTFKIHDFLLAKRAESGSV